MRVVRVLLLGLAACGFQHGQLGGTSDAPGGGGDDAAPGDPDAAMVVIDASPDAMPDAPPTKSWVAVEVLAVSASGATVMSTTVLANGVGYRLRASGSWVIQSPQGTPADAEYWDYVANQPTDGVPGIDVGLAINDPTNDSTKTPVSWGAYSASHVYEIDWTGNGAQLSARIQDGNHGNNTGSLTLTILAYQ